ncbi:MULTISPECIES: phage integrase family protein [unclassified Actinopolyspora]|uniref:phage integrase family protein n=1 Tax=unclassified Actinopolyspora TaxID=2639451 RepID=UPI0013F65D27|nr:MULTISPECIES: phage integrase family protein [unclassified Actinopolyspora]NHD17742.1 phage integrase family protein [Actinopolyspora sp. BKK2]NHE76525.1 phage integrase family protein [Actinopolyspora sp. BKK1]
MTHEALAGLSDWRTASFVRELLTHHGVLPHADKQLMLFERWLTQRLADIERPEHAQLIHRFATWHELRRLRRTAGHQPLRPSATNESRQRINRAADFLTWLDEARTDLEHCTQVDLDAWHTEHYATRRPAQAFLRWAMRAGHMPRLSWAWKSTTNPTPMAQHHRLARVRRLATDHTIPLRERVAGLLVLLYAQPVSRIARMTTHDVITHHDDVLLHLGESPTPAPAPLADLLRDLLTERTTSTGANHESDWLFPGRQPGHPLQHRSLGDALRRHGIPIQTGRTSALRHLVLQAPAPVVATMLGFHDKHTIRALTEAGGNWNRYAPGEHDEFG